MGLLYFVRHAEHDLVGKALVGRAPGIPLSAKGRAQAEALRTRFQRAPVARVLASPIERAQETAAAIASACGVPVETAEDLIEIDCGEWTGLTFEALRADPRWADWNDERERARIPGGEAMAAVRHRVAALMDRLSGAETPIALVSHSDVIKAAVAALIAMPLNLHDRIVVDPASLTTVEMWRPGAGRVVRLNEAAA